MGLISLRPFRRGERGTNHYYIAYIRLAGPSRLLPLQARQCVYDSSHGGFTKLASHDETPPPDARRRRGPDDTLFDGGRASHVHCIGREYLQHVHVCMRRSANCDGLRRAYLPVPATGGSCSKCRDLQSTGRQTARPCSPAGASHRSREARARLGPDGLGMRRRDSTDGQPTGGH